MKKISSEQIKAVLEAFYQANAGVQTYKALQDLFDKLPVVEEVKETLKNEQDIQVAK